MNFTRYTYQSSWVVLIMRVAEMLHSSKIYGPGERTVLWLQDAASNAKTAGTMSCGHFKAVNPLVMMKS